MAELGMAMLGFGTQICLPGIRLDARTIAGATHAASIKPRKPLLSMLVNEAIFLDLDLVVLDDARQRLRMVSSDPVEEDSPVGIRLNLPVHQGIGFGEVELHTILERNLWIAL